MNVTVTVMMSVYNPKNTEQFKSAVQSIIDQTYQNWEMIIYNDGSEENYRNEIKKIAVMDPRIRMLSGKHNRGLGAAMNVCIKNAKGKYLARMDADDISDKERFETQINFLDSNPEYTWVGSNVNLIDENGIWGQRDYPEFPEKEDYLKYSPFAHSSVMFRKEVFDCGTNYYPETRRGEDYALFMSLQSKGFKGYNIQQRLLNYRENLDNYGRMKYSDHLEEARIRMEGFREMDILNAKTLAYVMKPAAVGMIPKKMRSKIKPKIRKEMHLSDKKEN